MSKKSVASMQVKAEQSHIINKIKTVEDLKLLKSVKKFLFNKLNPRVKVDIDQYNREIDESTARVNAGHFATNEDAMKVLNKWRKKRK